MRMIRSCTLAAVLAVAALPASAGPQNADGSGVALDGYDPVAYFTEGEPVQGDPAITAEHNGAVWRFASEEHRDLFLADPARYAPAYDGYCAFGASQNLVVDVDPTIWVIHDGRLFVNATPRAQALFEADIGRRIGVADRNWPALNP